MERSSNIVVDTLKTAFMPVERDVPYVSHSRRVKSALVSAIGQIAEEAKGEPVLDSQNHAFYMGKMIRRTTGEKVRRLLGWAKPEERIYTEAFIEGALEYLFAHLKPGEKVQIVTCRVLSEIFNGPQDTENALSTKEQIEVIYRIAEKKFGKKRDKIEVTDLEVQPQHSELFTALRAAVDADTGEFDLEKAFGGENSERAGGSGSGGCDTVLDDPPSSLQIARCLYGAMRENEQLMQRFKKGIPAKLKQRGDQDLPKSTYSLVEIAIRLSEILRGRNIHGGANRQAVYDEVIEAFLKGGRASFKDTPALKPLFALFEGKNFETVHVDTEKNPYRLKREKRGAMARLATAGIVGLSVAAAPIAGYQYVQHKKKEAAEAAVQQYVRDQLSDEWWYTDHLKLPLAPQLNWMVSEFPHSVELRYRIPEHVQEKINLPVLFKQFLVENKKLMGDIANDYVKGRYAMAIDMFMRQNRIYLESAGIQLQRPYEHFKPYFPQILAAAAGPQKVADHFLPSDTIDRPLPSVGRKKSTSIGMFQSSGLGLNNYDMYLAEEDGRNFLLARRFFPGREFDYLNEKRLTAGTACEAARDFVKAVKLADILDVYEWELFFRAYNDEKRGYSDGWNHIDAIPGNIEDVTADPGGIHDTAGGIYDKFSRRYKDSFGEFEYQIIVSSYKDPRDGALKKCVMARIPGEKSYTMARAREAAGHFVKAIEGDFYGGILTRCSNDNKPEL